LAVGVCIDDRCVGKHDAQRAHRHHERTQADIPAVAVDGQRSAHGEVGVGLHDPHCVVVRVEESLQVAPADTRFDANRALDRREREDAVHRPHVEVQASRTRRLAAHAEVAAADRDRELGLPQRLLHVFDRRRARDGEHRHRVQPRDVVDDRAVHCASRCHATTK
jgi:hypothetical protein